MCELAKRITVPVTMDFMCVGSYGGRNEIKRCGAYSEGSDETIEDKEVLIVEDIVDSGNTLYYLMDVLKKRNPASIRLCTLLDKPERREKDVKADYCGFEVPDEFNRGLWTRLCPEIQEPAVHWCGRGPGIAAGRSMGFG